MSVKQEYTNNPVTFGEYQSTDLTFGDIAELTFGELSNRESFNRLMKNKDSQPSETD